MTAIKGLGLKTAACVLLIAMGRDVCPVDTHVARVAARVPLVDDARDAERVFFGLRPLIPLGRAGAFHVNVIRLGRELCRPSRPMCGECPLRRICGHGRRKSQPGSHQVQVPGPLPVDRA